MTKGLAAHFTISGEFITEQARSFWSQEDEPARAVALLKCLIGISDSQVLDILEGRSRLTGNSNIGVSLVPDEKKLPTLQETLHRLKSERDSARSDKADLVQILNGDVVGVPSPKGLRMVPERQTQKYRGRRILRKGLDWEGVEGRNPSDVEPPYFQEVKRSEPEEEEYEEAQRIPPKPSKSITGDTGWLSPEGDFFICRYGQHNETAWHMGKDQWELDAAGWVRLCVHMDDQCFFHHDYKTVTDLQKHRISVYCEEKKIEKPWWLRDSD